MGGQKWIENFIKDEVFARTLLTLYLILYKLSIYFLQSLIFLSITVLKVFQWAS